MNGSLYLKHATTARKPASAQSMIETTLASGFDLTASELADRLPIPLRLVRTAIKSPNYVAGTSGWSINQAGDAEFNDVTVRGEVDRGGAYIADDGERKIQAERLAVLQRRPVVPDESVLSSGGPGQSG